MPENTKIGTLYWKYPNINRFSFHIVNFKDGNLSLLKLHNVKYLSLNNTNLRCGRGRTFKPETSDMVIQEFIQNQPTLEDIDMDIILRTSTLDLLLNSPNLRSIEISTTIPRIARDFECYPTSSLQEIRLHGANILDLHLQTLCCNVKHLKELGIFYCRNISNEAFRKISQCKELDTLTIGHCESLTEDVYIKYISSCSWIKKIRINTAGNNDVFCEDVERRYHSRTYPIRLDENSMRYMFDIKFALMSDAGLHALASECRDLRELHLPVCEHITDFGVMAVADQCPQLEILDLTGCQNVTDFSLLALAEQSHGLHTLLLNECFHVTQVGVGPLIIKCRNLRKLGLTFAGFLQNLNLNQFLSLPGRFDEFFPNLNATAFGDQSVPVSNDEVQTHVDHSCDCLNPRRYRFLSEDVLIEVDVERCSKLANIADPRNFRGIYRGLTSQNSQEQRNETSVLERTDNTNSKNVPTNKITHTEEEDQTVNQTNLQGMKSPERVSIERKISSARERFLSCLSDPSLPSSRQHSSITHLNLQCCASLDDQSICQIAFHCPDLRILDIGECSRITDVSLNSIARNSHVLITLRMTGLPLCTKDGLLQLINSLDLLEQITLSVYSKSRITAADMKELDGQKSAKGKYISMDRFAMMHLTGPWREEPQLTLCLLSDAAYNRAKLKDVDEIF